MSSPMNVLRHAVVCHSCSTTYDSMAARWCDCVSKQPTLVCPACERCFCAAFDTFKQSFWSRAPKALWDRRLELRSPLAAWKNPEPRDVKRPLVLIADDEPLIRSMLLRLVLSLGYGAVAAVNGAEGLALAAQYRPELVIADALMPKLDGREMARQIKDLPDCSKTKVVMTTSVYKQAQQKYEALKSFGADEYLAKPIEAAVLTAILRRYLH